MASGRSPPSYQSREMQSYSEATESPSRIARPHQGELPPSRVPRPYQEELLQIALKENTIIALGTGCGKTHIACMLINEMTRTGSLSRRLKVLFLAPTDALVRQQTTVISDSTQLRVKYYMGGSGVSEWKCADWERELHTLDVMVMVAQTALNAINSGVLPVSCIGLLIFDECHHARKNHPYRGIMRTLETNVEKLKCAFPKILGLSASIVTKNLKNLDKVENEILELELILHSRAITTTDTKGMSVHVTNPSESNVYFDEFEIDKFKLALQKVNEMKLFLEVFLHKDEFNPGREFSAKNAVEACKSCITDCTYALGELGVASAIRCIDLCVDGLEKYRVNYLASQKSYLARFSNLNELETHFFCNTISVLKKFKYDLKRFDSSDDKYSPKVKQLCGTIDNFIKSKISSSILYSKSPSPMCGIVFTYRRIAAVLLEWIFNRKKSEVAPSGVECGHVVGHGGNCATSIGEMDIREQEHVLRQFRFHTLNLLTATNVLEEGLDVPQCNLIVRFDLPTTPRSYIQSKGRARNKEALLFHMIPKKDMAEHMHNIQTFQRIEKMLTNTCNSRSDASLEHRNDLEDIPPYTIPSTGAKLTGTSSVMLLNGYCQRFSRDPYSDSKPFCLSRKVNNHNTSGFVCKLRLPEKAPLQDVIESDVWPSNELARREVHMKTCVKLHEIGEIDDYLHVAKPSDKQLSSLLEGLSGLTLPNSKNSYYENKIPSALSKPLQLHYDGSSPHYIYRFIIVHRESEVPYWGQDKDEISHSDPNNYIGIITAESLPCALIPTFEIFYHELNLMVSLELIATRTPLNKIYSQLAKFQDSVFIEIIRCNMEIFKYTPNESNKRSFMICPLVDIEGGKWDFDTECLDTFISNAPRTADFEEFYLNRVVTSSYHVPKRYFHIVRVSDRITLRSRFPDPDFSTYEEYYRLKRGITFREEDLSKHALEAVYVSGHINLITSRHKTVQGKDLPKRDFSRHQNLNLFSPHLTAHPIPSTLWRLCVILPSILWRLESFLLMEEVASRVDRMGAAGGKGCSSSSEGSDVNGARHGHLNYETQPELCIEKSSCGESPNLISLLTACTAASAGDLVNLERQEFLGDSFLKLISSIHYFTTDSKRSERDLSELRLKFVSNETLHALGARKGFVSVIRVAAFDVRTHYSPPGYSFKTQVLEQSIKHISPGKDMMTTAEGFRVLSENRGNIFKSNPATGHQLPFCFQQFNDKTTADCIEAVLCAYVQSGGIHQGIKFLSYLDPEIGSSTSFTGSVPSEHFTEMGHFFSPTNAFSHYWHEYQSKSLHLKYSLTEVSDLPPEKWKRIQQFQNSLNYKFDNILLLVEAFTHSSFMAKITPSGKARPSYQRLEFLGDALLDYFTCVYMYQKYKNFLPEQLTQLRTAVVNNKRLSTIALKCHWYLCILSNEKLTASINSSYYSYQQEMASSQDYERIQYPKPLADVVEAIVAAVFVDSKFSLDTIWTVFSPIFKPIIDELALNIPRNPINLLYESVPRDKLAIKVKRLERQRYECTIRVKEMIYTEYGDSQDTARYICARAALDDLT